MISRFFLGLFLLISFQANAVEPSISRACAFAHPESLSAFACLRSATIDRQNGKTEVEVVAEICDAMADIPENVPLFRQCFEASLPQTPIPPGYPTTKVSTCSQFANSVLDNRPNSKVVENWQCKGGEEVRLGNVARTEHCFSQWQFEKNKKTENRLTRNFLTTIIPPNDRAYSFWSNESSYDLRTMQMIILGPLTVSGKIHRVDSQWLQIQEIYKMRPNTKSVTDYILDKSKKTLTINHCYWKYFSCKDKSTKTIPCHRVD